MKYVHRTADNLWPWALVPWPLTVLLSAWGDAYVEFELEEGDGECDLIVAYDAMDKTIGPHMDPTFPGPYAPLLLCRMSNGKYELARAGGDFTPWRSMEKGDIVRVRFVAATRMVSVVWDGEEHRIGALPTKWNAANYRFGVILGEGNTMRLVGSSLARM